MAVMYGNETGAEPKTGARPESPARTWTVTLAISFALLVTMYGLAYLNEAHSQPQAAATVAAPAR